MLEIISTIIYNKKYVMRSIGSFFLVTNGSAKFLIHKRLFKNVVDERNIRKVFEIIKFNKELIIYRT